MADAPDQESRAGSEHLDRADLFLCLSRAFMAPPRGLAPRDWAEPLAEDLAELGQALGLDTAETVSALRSIATDVGLAAGTEPLLVEYARLFLAPPIRAPLNAGLYLEGALAGNSAQMIQGCYERGGFGPNPEFRDLPDHVAMQLEFLGRLHERAASGNAEAAALAAEFAQGFVVGWAAPLAQACDAARDDVPVAAAFAALARLLAAAVT